MGKIIEKHQCNATIRQYGYARQCQTPATVLIQDYRGNDIWYCKRHASCLNGLINREAIIE